jgi:AraC-like DNA-binding protein
MSATILASAARSLWRVAESHDLDSNFIFREAGLDPSLIDAPRSRYPFERVCKAAIKAAHLAKSPHLGIQATEHYSPTDLHALGIAFLSSKTLLGALKRLIRYESIMNSKIKLSLVETPDRVDLICEGLELGGDATKLVEDVRTSILLDLCRQGVGGSLDPVEVAFTYAEPGHSGEHFAFFRCPLVFSANVSRLSFSKSDTERPFTTSNHDLARINDQVLDHLLSTLSAQDIVSKVKHAIVEHLPSGTPTEEDISKELFTSPRTLNRRLAEQETSFRQLITAVRLELAERYMTDPDIPLTEVSFLLGFSDTSSFSRAFKRWTGVPPNVYRSNHH